MDSFFKVAFQKSGVNTEQSTFEIHSLLLHLLTAI